MQRSGPPLRGVCAALPVMLTSSGDSWLGPEVGRLQPRNEQRFRARSLSASLVFCGNSSRLLIKILASFETVTNVNDYGTFSILTRLSTWEKLENYAFSAP